MVRTKKRKLIVKAALPFVDARTGKSYKPGDVVTQWEDERAKHYAEIGLVTIDESQEKENPQMTIEDAPKKEPEKTKESEDKKPGPEETKPKRGASKTK